MSIRPRQYYFTEKLNRQLAASAGVPLTVVEAPAGFGKTTAVRHFLKERASEGARHHWYTCLGESVDGAWKGICHLFAQACPQGSTKLMGLNLPSLDNLYQITSCLADLSIEQETYLVVDNFQLLPPDIPQETLAVFALHGNPHLHLILITRHLTVGQRTFVSENHIHLMGADALFFSKEDTARLFDMEGLPLSEAELNRVYRMTEGWISAIRLQLIHYQETGDFTRAGGIEDLVETAVWDPLTAQEQSFLLALALLNTFSMGQAAIVAGQEVLPQAFRQLLRHNDFLRFIPDQRRYTMHSILRDFLERHIRYHSSPAEQEALHLKAAKACESEGDYVRAAELYLALGEWEAILAMTFDLPYFDGLTREQTASFAQAAEACSEEALNRHPLQVLLLCYVLLRQGYDRQYDRLSQNLADRLISPAQAGGTKEARIRGEYLLLQAHSHLQDIRTAGGLLEEAWDCLKQPSMLLGPRTTAFFPHPSPFDLFWQQAGKLDETLDLVRFHQPVYDRLTEGRRRGTASLFQGEVALMGGREAEADILAHQALLEAGQRHQEDLNLGAQALLARLALLKGDAEAFSKAQSQLARLADEPSRPDLSLPGQLALADLSLRVASRDRIPAWLYDPDKIKERIKGDLLPLALLLHMEILLMDKQYVQVRAFCNLLDDDSPGPAPRFEIVRLKSRLLLSQAARAQGKAKEADRYLVQALALALPDGILFPFARHQSTANALPKLNRALFAENKSQLATLEQLEALCSRYAEGLMAIRRERGHHSVLLTPREREIALLAQKRLTAKEIGAQLFISDQTVRTTLRNIYRKLNIHSRTELIRLTL